MNFLSKVKDWVKAHPKTALVIAGAIGALIVFKLFS